MMKWLVLILVGLALVCMALVSQAGQPVTRPMDFDLKDGEVRLHDTTQVIGSYGAQGLMGPRGQRTPFISIVLVTGWGDRLQTVVKMGVPERNGEWRDAPIRALGGSVWEPMQDFCQARQEDGGRWRLVGRLIYVGGQ